MSFDFATVFIFLIMNLAVGLAYGSKVKNIRQFAVGDRDFKTFALVATIIATWVSGGAFSAIVQHSYMNGILIGLASLGIATSFLVVAYIYAPRMGGFLGSLSIGETMGKLYGPKIRTVTAIAAVVVSVGFVAEQMKVISYLFHHFMDLEGNIAVFISCTVIITYSAIGGIRAVTLTDALQSLTFGIFLPLMLVAVLKSAGGFNNVMINVPKEFFVIDFSGDRYKYYVILFIWFVIPGLNPATFQRMLMASSTEQMKVAFRNSAVIFTVFIAIVSLIGMAVFVKRPGLVGEENIVAYIMDNYSWYGIKGLTLCGIIAMIMSTADSHINSSAVACIHDLYNPIKKKLFKEVDEDEKTDTQKKREQRVEMILLRVSSVVVGLLAVIMALNANNLIEMLMATYSYYMPVITVPLTFAILGFRTTTRAVSIGMAAGALTVMFWGFGMEEFTGLGDLFPGMIMNAVLLLLSHYILESKSDNGWVGR